MANGINFTWHIYVYLANSITMLELRLCQLQFAVLHLPLHSLFIYAGDFSKLWGEVSVLCAI